jgi:predicted metal-dependent phosphoesterase TrpH
MRSSPLLCELHAHTRWSDGALSIRELADLYGEHGFDVLCVTDHIVRRDDPWGASGTHRYLTADRMDAYLAEIDAEAERAHDRYGLLVLAGAELTYDDVDPRRGAHAVAVGLRSFVSVDDGLLPALEQARAHGAALIAAHPYSIRAAATAHRATAGWAADWTRLRPHVDRIELVNRTELFEWVATAGVPAVANGDFHRPEHLCTWKTLLPCERNAAAVVEYLRSDRPAYLVDLSRAEVREREAELVA